MEIQVLLGRANFDVIQNDIQGVTLSTHIPINKFRWQ